ncbi:MAG: DUF1631 domain-containing protein [Gammaproteobacteria bacterium]|nr:DUF1631 domain-containing protein [Gammaproteobacteria bacterium]
MSSITKNHTGNTTNGSEVFEKVLNLNVQGIGLLLTNMFHKAGDSSSWNLSDKESKRLVAQIYKKKRIIKSSFIFQIKKNFADFKAIRKIHPGENAPSSWLEQGAAGKGAKDQTLTLDETIFQFEERYYEYYQLAAKRLGHCVSRTRTELDDNPMHVRRLYQSFLYAIDNPGLEVQHKKSLFRLFSDTVIEKLEPLYISVEQCFIEHQVLPDIKLMPRSGPVKEENKQPLPDHAVAMSCIPTIMVVVQAFMEKSEFSGENYTNLFPELKEELASHDISDFDHLLDQLAVKFDFFFHDDDLPNRIKTQIARLQIYLFLSSVQDSNLLKRSSNPARRLLDTILRTETDFAVEQMGERSGYEYLHNQIDRLSNNSFIEPSVYVELLDGYIQYTSGSDEPRKAVVEQLSPGIEPESEPESEPGPEIKPEEKPEEKAISIVEAVVQAFTESDQNTELKSETADNNENIFAVVQSIVSDVTLPLRVQGRSLILFDEVWSPLLQETAQSKGFKSPSWMKFMTLAKTQAWLLTPKSTRLELDRLKSTIATMEESLNYCMQLIKLPAEQQTSLLDFFQHELAEVIEQTKTTIKQLSKKKDLKTTQEETGKHHPPITDLAGTIDEFSELIRTTGQFDSTENILNAIDNEGNDDPISTPTTANMIHKSDWIEIKKDSTSILAKLTWKSKDHTQFIFVDRDGHRVCEIDAVELNKELEEGNISLISSIPATSERAVFSVLRSI